MRVYTSGCFDLLHTGHLNILEKAKSLGDYLIVAVSNSQLMIKKKKIEIVPFKDRMRMVAALRCVDKVVEERQIFDVDQFKKLGCDIFVIGSDWKERHDIPRLNQLRDNNQIIFLPYTQGISTTFIKQSIVEKIRCKK